MSQTVLSVRNISKSFGGIHAVRDVSFEVARGEVLGLIGPNGSGKSTLFNCVLGQLQPAQMSTSTFDTLTIALGGGAGVFLGVLVGGLLQSFITGGSVPPARPARRNTGGRSASA